MFPSAKLAEQEARRTAATGAQSARARGLFAAFDQGLKELGWIGGQNVFFQYRFAEGNVDGLAKLAAELANCEWT
jgi:hypothetical protein